MKVLVSDVVAQQFGGRMRAVAPGVEFIRLLDDRTFDGEVTAAEAVCFSSDLFQRNLYLEIMGQLPNLAAMRWFHAFVAGLDHPIFRSMAERGVVVTNSAGYNAVPIAQYVLAMMLRHAKRIPEWEAAQREKAWRRVDSDELTGRTVALIGVGNIGREVARLARPFDMRVIGVRRSQSPERDVDLLLPPQRLHEALGEAYAKAGYDAVDRGIGIEDHVVTGPERPGELVPSEMPGAVIEGLFLSNEEDATFIESEIADETIVGAYEQAITRYFSVYPG